MDRRGTLRQRSAGPRAPGAQDALAWPLLVARRRREGGGERLRLWVVVGLSIAALPPLPAVGELAPGAVAVEGVAAPDPTAPLTLEQALGLALAHNPALSAAGAALEAGVARAETAARPPNPELDLRLQRIDESAGRTDEAQRRAIVRQTFELGGKPGRRAGLAAAERELARHERDALRAEVVARTKQHFVEVLGAQGRVAAYERLVAALDELREAVDQLVANGTLGSLALHQAVLETGEARIELGEMRRDLGTARAALAATWGGTGASFGEAAGELAPPPPPPPLAALVEASRRSAAVAPFAAEVERQRAALGLARAERVPDVTYGVGVRWDERVDERGYLVDLELPLPLFDRNQGEIRAARAELAGASAARLAAEAQVTERLAASYHALEEARERGRLLAELILPAARAAVEAYSRAFERSASSPDDLADARRDLAEGEARLAEAIAEAHGAQALLEQLAGPEAVGAE